MAVNVYVLEEGLSGGYLPDNVEYYTSKATLFRRMADIARDLRSEGYRVEGSAEVGYTYKRADQDWYPYCVAWDILCFATRKDALTFIAYNSE